jgi:hypothetical protein
MDIDNITIIDSNDGWVTVFINGEQSYQSEKEKFKFSDLIGCLQVNWDKFNVIPMRKLINE